MYESRSRRPAAGPAPRAPPRSFGASSAPPFVPFKVVREPASVRACTGLRTAAPPARHRGDRTRTRLDVEVITVATILPWLGLERFELKLNSMGGPMPPLLELLAGVLAERAGELCDEPGSASGPIRCASSTARSPSAARRRRRAPAHGPPLRPCAAHFARVRQGLEASTVAYVLDHRLVRGSTTPRTTFEFARALESARTASAAAAAMTASSRCWRRPDARTASDRIERVLGLRRRERVRVRTGAPRRLRDRRHRGDGRGAEARDLTSSCAGRDLADRPSGAVHEVPDEAADRPGRASPHRRPEELSAARHLRPLRGPVSSTQWAVTSGCCGHRELAAYQAT